MSAAALLASASEHKSSALVSSTLLSSQQFATIGIWEFVLNCAQETISTLFAASVMGNIELKTKKHALLCSNLEDVPEEALIAKQVEQVLEGPKPLQSVLGSKRKADDMFDIP